MLSFVKCATKITKRVNAILEPWSYGTFKRNGWMSLLSSGTGKYAQIEPGKLGYICG